jgi:hypothetical protein
MRSLESCVGTTRAAFVAVVLAVSFLFAGSAANSAIKDAVGIELNKLSDAGSGCQAYFLFDNQGADSYRKLKIDLVVLNSDAVFERWFVLNAAPLEAKKRTMKMYEFSQLSCDEIGSFLINGVVECQQGKRSKKDCGKRLVPSSRVDVELMK